MNVPRCSPMMTMDPPPLRGVAASRRPVMMTDWCCWVDPLAGIAVCPPLLVLVCALDAHATVRKRITTAARQETTERGFTRTASTKLVPSSSVASGTSRLSPAQGRASPRRWVATCRGCRVRPRAARVSRNVTRPRSPRLSRWPSPVMPLGDGGLCAVHSIPFRIVRSRCAAWPASTWNVWPASVFSSPFAITT